MDLLNFEKYLTEELISDITKFSHSHANEDIYGFSLDCNIYESEIILSANTIGHLNETAAECSKNEYYSRYSLQEITDKLRWSTGDWKHMEIAIGYGHGETWDIIEKKGHTEGEIHKTIIEEFMVMLCRTAVTIEMGGLFEKLWPGKNIHIFCIEHDESETEAKNRLSTVEKTLK